MRLLSFSLLASLLAATAIAQTTTTPAGRTNDSNSAVSSPTPPNVTAPARGANSFTEGQAKGKIEDKGYVNVSGLQKDDDGIWHGRAQKDGSQVNVWLDYKGDVGHQ